MFFGTHCTQAYAEVSMAMLDRILRFERMEEHDPGNGVQMHLGTICMYVEARFHP